MSNNQIKSPISNLRDCQKSTTESPRGRKSAQCKIARMRIKKGRKGRNTTEKLSSAHVKNARSLEMSPMTLSGHKTDTLLCDWLQQPAYCYLTLHFLLSRQVYNSDASQPRSLGLGCSLSINTDKDLFSLERAVNSELEGLLEGGFHLTS